MDGRKKSENKLTLDLAFNNFILSFPFPLSNSQFIYFEIQTNFKPFILNMLIYKLVFSLHILMKVNIHPFLGFRIPIYI